MRRPLLAVRLLPRARGADLQQPVLQSDRLKLGEPGTDDLPAPRNNVLNDVLPKLRVNGTQHTRPFMLSRHPAAQNL